jgi:hypothetical protein
MLQVTPTAESGAGVSVGTAHAPAGVIKPEPVSVTSVPAAAAGLGPPLFGVNVSVAKTRKFAVEESAVLPVAFICHPGGTAPPPVALTVNVHPAAMLPPETEHVNVAGKNRLGGPTELEIVTMLSAPLKPDPVTVTTSSILPWNAVSPLIERLMMGPPVTTKFAFAEGGAPVLSVYVMIQNPDPART